MTCGPCVPAVTKALKGREAVGPAHVFLADRRALVVACQSVSSRSTDCLRREDVVYWHAGRAKVTEERRG